MTRRDTGRDRPGLSCDPLAPPDACAVVNEARR